MSKIYKSYSFFDEKGEIIISIDPNEEISICRRIKSPYDTQENCINISKEYVNDLISIFCDKIEGGC